MLGQRAPIAENLAPRRRSRSAAMEHDDVVSVALEHRGHVRSDEAAAADQQNAHN